MKQKGPELGRLSSSFFSYVQLKKKSIVYSGELTTVLGITPNQEKDLLSRLSLTGWIVRLKRGVYLVPNRIPAGGQYSPGVAVIVNRLMQEYKAKYQICGPSAFNYYGFSDQVSNITYVYNDCLSASRKIGGLDFLFIKIEERRLGGTIAIKSQEGMKIVYSSKVRTLIDAVYNWKRFNSLPRGYQWTVTELKKDPGISEELVKTAINYSNQSSMKRIGYLLEKLGIPESELELLLEKIRSPKALIPFLPNMPRIGKINARWGVIINGTHVG